MVVWRLSFRQAIDASSCEMSARCSSLELLVDVMLCYAVIDETREGFGNVNVTLQVFPPLTRINCHIATSTFGRSNAVECDRMP